MTEASKDFYTMVIIPSIMAIFGGILLFFIVGLSEQNAKLEQRIKKIEDYKERGEKAKWIKSLFKAESERKAREKREKSERFTTESERK